MPKYTLSWDSNIPGWVSFYSFYPEKIIGMNNYLYTFKNGNLYRHNVNDNRNVFYGVTDPALGARSEVTSIVNRDPLANKLFKTFYLESDDTWEGEFTTDVITGFIKGNTSNSAIAPPPAANYWQKKESDFFAFIRTNQLPESGSGTSYSTSPDLQLRSVNGIGNLLSVDTTNPTGWVLTFASTITINPVFVKPGDPTTGVGGDLIYNFAGTPNPNPVGLVSAITASTITVNPTGYSGVAPNPTDLLFSVKNSIAESNGLLGHYLEFKLTNINTNAVELFAVGSDVMVSEPNPRSK